MRISILGCGWLGFPLAQYLVEKGQDVKGSVTSKIKETALSEIGVKPYTLFWKDDGFEGDLKSFLKTDVLIITIPPSKVAASGGLQKLTSALLPSLETATVPNVIFISSISVYGNGTGEISEETAVLPETPGAKDIVAAERILLSAPFLKVTVLRFGGLVGPGRHPVKHLAGRENVADPNAAINLIHLNDCIGIIEGILKQEKWGYIFNGVAPFHPSRKDFYTQKALSLGLPSPVFTKEASGSGKIVLSQNVRDLLHYDFSVTETI